MDEKLAAEIREFRSPTDGETRMFYEIVVAPDYTEEGLAVLKGKSKALRILKAVPRAPSGRSLRQVAGTAKKCSKKLSGWFRLGIFTNLSNVRSSVTSVNTFRRWLDGVVTQKLCF